MLSLVLLITAVCSLQLDIPTIDIGLGVKMPLVGLGSWLYNSTTAYESTKSALEIGYTHFDTAYDYQNSDGIGRAFKESTRDRKTYFVTTKIEGGLSYNDTIKEHLDNLDKLQLDQVDLLLTHFPCTMEANPKGGADRRQQQWKALEYLFSAGKTRAIGTSHFCRRHMEDILKVATIKPAVNQVEYHVGMGQAGSNATDDKQWLESQGIVFQGFSPLCGPCCMGDTTGKCTYNKDLINGPIVTTIGKKYNKTGVQIALKWQVQQNIPVIPKTSNPKHQLQNAQLFDFTLSDKDMETLSLQTSPPVVGGGDGINSGDCGLP